MTSDTITILTERYGTRLAKSFTRTAEGGWDKQGFPDNSAFFSYREEAVNGVGDLYRLLKDTAARVSDTIIRAKPTAEVAKIVAENGFARRNKQLYRATPRRWAMFDIDDMTAPESYDIRERPEELVAWVIRERFPAEFQDTKIVWQLSSSAGIGAPNAVKLHLFAWLSRLMGWKELEAWKRLGGLPVDGAPFRDVQVMYLADPVFVGAPDPCPNRWGITAGSREAIEVPFIDMEEAKEIANSRGIDLTAKAVPGVDVSEILSRLGDQEGGYGFHDPILAANMKWACTTPPAFIDDMEARAAHKLEVRAAARAAYRRPGRTVQDVERYLTDDYLDGDIETAVRKAWGDRKRKEAEVPVWRSVGEAEAVSEYAALRFFYEAWSTPERYRWQKYPDVVVAPDLRPRAENEPYQAALLVTPGVGKSERVLRTAAGFVGEGSSKRVHVYAPDNTLADELQARAKKRGIKARVHKGRTAEKNGVPQCDPSMHEIAAEVEKAGGSVAQMVCPTCPFLKKCPWQQQRADKAPGLVIMPQNYLTTPGELTVSCDATIIDEEFVLGLASFVRVDFRALTDPRVEGVSGEDADYLSMARTRLANAIAGGSGLPTLSQLFTEGITAAVAERAKRIEYQRHKIIRDALQDGLKEGLPPKAVLAKTTPLREKYGDAGKYAKVWNSIEKQLAPEVTQHRDTLNGFRLLKDGADLLVGYRKKIKTQEIQALALDATGEERLLRLALPYLTRVDRAFVEHPDTATIWQIVDRKYGKTALVPGHKDDEAAKQAKARRRGRIADLVEVARGSVGLITYKDVEESRQVADAAARLGPRLLTGHFQRLRGQNGFKGVGSLIVAGRPLPEAWAVENIAGALFFDQPEAVVCTGAYVEGVGHYRLKGMSPFNEETRAEIAREDGEKAVYGVAVEGRAEVHADPIVEMVRRLVTEAEVEQAVGRARAVRRGVDDPVVVTVLTSTPMSGVVLDELMMVEEITPSRLDVLTARGAVWFERPQHAFKFFPGRWSSEEAARKAYKRGQVGHSPMNTFYREDEPLEISKKPELNNHAVVKYLLAGPKQRSAHAAYDAEVWPDFRAVLDGRLGPLAKFEIIDSGEQSTRG